MLSWIGLNDVLIRIIYPKPCLLSLICISALSSKTFMDGPIFGNFINSLLFIRKHTRTIQNHREIKLKNGFIF